MSVLIRMAHICDQEIFTAVRTMNRPDPRQ